MASVAELLFERGQRAAQAIREQGAIKAQALGNLGQIGAGAVQAYGQAKDAEAKAADEARKQALFANGMPDPETLMAEFGPEKASAIIGGYKALEDWNSGKIKNAREEAGRVAMGLMVLPETVRQSAWPQVKQLAVKAGFPVQDLPDVATPEFLQSVVTMATGQAPAKPEAPKTRQITVKNADGSETIQVVEDKPGLSFTSAPTPEKVTLGEPKTAWVNGKETVLRFGSDGTVVNALTKAPLPPDVRLQMSEPGGQKVELVPTVGPNGVPVWGPKVAGGVIPQPGGMTPDSGLPPEISTALSRATLTMTAPKRSNVIGIVNQLYREGRPDEIAGVIKQAAIEGENVDVKNQVLGRMATAASLADTRQILNEMKAAGVPTGYFSGTAEDLVRKLGKTTDPRYVSLANRLQGTLINYRRAATGAAFGEREGSAYEKMFPNYRNDLPVNLALIEGLEREMRTYDDVYWKNKLGEAGYKLISGGSAGASDPLGIRKGGG